MKKAIAIICSLVIFLCSAEPAFSAELSFDEMQYEAAVAEIMSTYSENPEYAIEALKDLDTVLSDEPIITECNINDDNDFHILANLPSDYTFTVYSFKRGNSRRIYLQWQLTANKKESYPGPLDYIGLEWDTAYASLADANGDNVVSTTCNYGKGIVIFNVEDKNLKKGEYTYGTVQVSPSPTKSGTLRYGAKFVHTYTSLLVTGSATISFTPSASIDGDGSYSLGLSYTNSFTVNISSKTSKWQRWIPNSVSV